MEKRNPFFLFHNIESVRLDVAPHFIGIRISILGDLEKFPIAWNPLVISMKSEIVSPQMGWSVVISRLGGIRRCATAA